MAYHKVVSQLMSFSVNSYYIWKKENRPIISLLHKYLNEDDIKEFLATGSISKFDNIDYVKYDFNKNYFEFLFRLDENSMYIFLQLLKLNQNDLLTFSSNFISIIINYDCQNHIKSKLIESYSKVEDKNKLFYFGLKNMLNNKFKDFYEFSIEYIDSDHKYNMATKHLKAYIKFFSKDTKILTFYEKFPELSSSEYKEYLNHENKFWIYEYEKNYYEYLLELVENIV